MGMYSDQIGYEKWHFRVKHAEWTDSVGICTGVDFYRFESSEVSKLRKFPPGFPLGGKNWCRGARSLGMMVSEWLGWSGVLSFESLPECRQSDCCEGNVIVSVLLFTVSTISVVVFFR